MVVENQNKQQNKNTVKIGIKLKLIGILLPLVVIVFGMILFLVYRNTSSIVLNKSEEILRVNTESVVNKVSGWIQETLTALDVEKDALEYFDMGREEMLDYIKHTVNRYESFPSGIYVGTLKGELLHASFVPGPEYKVSEKAWYQEGLKSDKFVFGAVYLDEDSKENVVAAYGNLRDKNGEVWGVASADIYLKGISEIVKPIRIEETGGTFLVDTETGIIIGHREDALAGTSLSEQAGGIYQFINTSMAQNKTGLMTYEAEGEQVYIDLEPVPDSPWIAVAYVPHGEIMKELDSLTQMMVGIAVFGVILLCLFMERLIHMTVKPVKKLSRVIASITGGDFSQNISVKSRDEIGVMAQGLQGFILTMREIIGEISRITADMHNQAENSVAASENLSNASDMEFEAITEMGRAVNELTISIGEVAESAVSLNGFVSDTKERGEAAGMQMQKAVDASDTGRDDMERVVVSMKDISEKINHLETSAEKMDSSIGEINRIVELIRSIAEETNLLSLNASIEAARAGEAGKGFAVVADQIGKLAQTSRDAVDDIAALTNNISGLVERTVKETRDSASAIKESTNMVKETGEAFGVIYESIHQADAAVADMVEKVEKVNEIAAAVAGTTQEQSAASEEILATTENIKENARLVSETSTSVAGDAEMSQKYAEDLSSHMAMFKQ